MNGSHHRSLLTNREREIFALLLAEKQREILQSDLVLVKNSAKSHFQYNSKARCNESISGVN